MTKKTLIWAIICTLVIGLGVLGYCRGYYDAFRGGIAESSDRNDAILHYKKALEKNPDAFMVAHDLACCYAVIGDQKSCFYWLRQALKSSYAGYAKHWAKTEKDFDSVRETPEFQSLIYDSPGKK